jgi:pimeloyl-ACP methyl ester carboxylesterase
MTRDHSVLPHLSTNEVVESAKLSVNGHQAHYLKAGSGDPVVLLHGGVSDSRDWLGTLDALADSYTCYAPDLIGYGYSEGIKEGYYLSDFVEFAMGFTEALGLQSSVMVGHSLGGRVCLEIAFRYPEMVRRLVLINTAGFSKLGRWGAFLGTLVWQGRMLLRHRQPYPKFLKENGKYGDWLCLDELPSLRVPTLVLWSRHDLYYSLAGARQAVALIPEARLEVLPCCGHASHVRRRDSFNRILLEFLSDG